MDPLHIIFLAWFATILLWVSYNIFTAFALIIYFIYIGIAAVFEALMGPEEAAKND
jgi:hypothetical protein